MTGRPTLATIAELVGVTPMTVSNAYNRPEKLSAPLRERILATAAELGYPGPHPTARSLRRGRAGALGVLVGESLPYAFDDPGAVAFLQGVARACRALGSRITVLPGGGESDDDLVSDALVDGLLLYGVFDGEPLVEAAQRRGVPIVIQGGPLVGGAPLVTIDDRRAAADAARHVLELGHRRIAVVSLPIAPARRAGPIDGQDRERALHRVTRERLAGYAEAIEAAGLDWDEVPLWAARTSSVPAGEEAARELLGGPQPPTAILAMSDQLAVGVVGAAEARGRSVPRELSVVGFDDLPGATGPVELTTVRQSLRAQGQRAGELALAAPRAEPGIRWQPWELAVRASTAPLG